MTPCLCSPHPPGGLLEVAFTEARIVQGQGLALLATSAAGGGRYVSQWGGLSPPVGYGVGEDGDAVGWTLGMAAGPLRVVRVFEVAVGVRHEPEDSAGSVA